jgi:hypothetical protein
MLKRLRCNKGHQWEVKSAGPAADPLAGNLCPKCGSAAETVLSATEPADNTHPNSPWWGQNVVSAPKVPGYEILGELGRGGMGVVYLAKNVRMERLEVLKVVNQMFLAQPGAAERFLREIRSAARLSHPNIVTAYAAPESGNLLVFAMEYVPGEDLAKVVKGRGPLPVPHACAYAYQAALGLQHAFEKGMVHRDIKPGNLILARDGKKHVIKILDFGLAKATREKGGPGHDLTGTGQMMGTPDYVAPEQTLDAARADIRADIYSLGCTLYFLLTGSPPFRANSLYEMLHAHQTREATSLSHLRREVPAELAAVVARMLAKDPARRYQQPVEVAQALAPFVKAGGTPLPAAPTPAEVAKVRVPSAPGAARKAEVNQGRGQETTLPPPRIPEVVNVGPLHPAHQPRQPAPLIPEIVSEDYPPLTPARKKTAAGRAWRLLLGVSLAELLLVVGALLLTAKLRHDELAAWLDDVTMRGGTVKYDKRRLFHPVVKLDIAEGTDKDMKYLAELHDLQDLQDLSLGGRKVTDAGLAHLKRLTALEHLHLYGTGVTDAGLAHLKGLKALQYLSMDDANVTEAGVKDLKQALPKSIIRWSPRRYSTD